MGLTVRQSFRYEYDDIHIKVLFMAICKLDGVGPVDNRPSTAEAPPIGKIHPFSKIAVTLEPVMRL